MRVQCMLNSGDFLSLIKGKIKHASLPERKAFWQHSIKNTFMMGKEMCDTILEGMKDIPYSETEDDDLRVLFEHKLQTNRKTTYDCVRLSITMRDLRVWFLESDNLWELLVSDMHPVMTREEREEVHGMIKSRTFENPFIQRQRDMCLAAFDKHNRYRLRYVMRRDGSHKSVNLSAIVFRFENVFYYGWNKPLREYNDGDEYCIIKKVMQINEY